MNKSLIILLLTVIIFVAACEKKPDNSAKLAEVNGEVLSLDAFKSTFGVEEWDSLDVARRKQYVEDWVNLTLLAQEAERQKLDEEPSLQQRISYATKKVKANALIAEELSRINISEDQLFSYFRIHQAEFIKPVLLYDIRRIRLQDKISAENVLQQLNSGMRFDAAVRQYSTGELKYRGGAMGFVSPESEDSLFWQAASAIEPDEYGIVNADNAWYIISYTQSKEGDSEANFENHRAEIRRRIILERQEEVYQKLLRQIKAKQQNIYYY